MNHGRSNNKSNKFWLVSFPVLATLNERFRHCLSMTKMLNSENLLGDSGLEPHSTPCTADKILYNYAIEQCQAAALDELFGNPEECFLVFSCPFLFLIKNSSKMELFDLWFFILKTSKGKICTFGSFKVLKDSARYSPTF